MQEGNTQPSIQPIATNSGFQEVVIRIGRNTLSFTAKQPGATGLISHEPYVVKSGISMAANLREAFRTSPLLQQPFSSARVVLDTPVLMVPREQFSEETAAELFAYTFPSRSDALPLSEAIESLSAVAVFGINRDLRLVIDDHFPTVTFCCAMSAVWRHIHRHHSSVAGSSMNRLFAYFHEGQLDVFCFQKNRFKFCNQFEAPQAADALYYLLYVWKQLVFSPDQDEVCLVGDLPQNHAGYDLNADGQCPFVDELRRFVGRVSTIDLDGEATETSVMPFDLTLHIR